MIRDHLGEVKSCYEPELVKKPDLQGRMTVQFTIAASGRVVAAALEESTMGDALVESCTVAAVHRWQFPELCSRGILIVSYPFVLTPGRNQRWVRPW
jgi:TonB family protein